MRFENKVCLVTGGTRGIGKAITIGFAREGANLIIVGQNEQNGINVSREIEQLGRKCIFIKANVSNKSEVEMMLKKSLEFSGRIDIACNNAGVSSMARAVDISEEEWDYNMNVNAKGIFLTNQVEARQMIKQGHGKIINIASMASKRGVPFLAHYVASKYAVLGFSKTLALELAQYGINVNCVCPGLVKTEMQEREVSWEAELRGISIEDVYKDYVSMTPLGRLEEPEDVAKVVLFLASKDSDFMTGQGINVTGGIEMN
jgi:NAD(P)-dependent dehydrogenase (short-subunit alcohol dehydrogenase family)